jgi:hypothetical protein
MDSSSGSESEVPEQRSCSSENITFVRILRKFPVLLWKSQLPAVKDKKERAKKSFLEKWTNNVGTDLTEKALMNKIQNMKSRVIGKVDKNKIGNKKISLDDWERDMLEILHVDSNPAICKTPVILRKSE